MVYYPVNHKIHYLHGQEYIVGPLVYSGLVGLGLFLKRAVDCFMFEISLKTRPLHHALFRVKMDFRIVQKLLRRCRYAYVEPFGIAVFSLIELVGYFKKPFMLLVYFFYTRFHFAAPRNQHTAHPRLTSLYSK